MNAAADDVPSGPPMFLRAWSDNNTTVLAWEPPVTENITPVEYYNVYQIGEEGLIEFLESVDVPQFIASGDSNDLVIYFVTAVGGGGESAPSNPTFAYKDWPKCDVIWASVPPMINLSCLEDPPLPPS